MNHWRQAPTIATLLLCLLPLTLPAQQAILERLAKAPNMKHGLLGAHVIDVESGEVVASYAADLSLQPASTLKTLTTATALGVLGPAYRFTTEILHSGAIDDEGTLQGDLLIRGSGDPSLGSPELDEAPDMEAILAIVVRLVREAGISRIAGRVLVDDRAFDSAVQGSTWQWNDLGNYYAAGAWGFNVHENLYYLDFERSTGAGRPTRVAAIRPEVPGLHITNEVMTAGPRSGDQAYLYGAAYSHGRYLRGTIPAGRGPFTIKGSLPDPPQFFAFHLDRALAEAGVPCAGDPATARTATGAMPDKGSLTPMGRMVSPPLRILARHTNQESVNLYAEAMLRTLSRDGDTPGSAEGGLEVIETFWEDRGVSLDGCHLRDGSGLSARNGVTARFLAEMLRSAAGAPWFQAFYRSLPAPGGAGTLEHRMNGTPAEGRLRAKSGSIDRVRAYAGYARNAEGRLRAFAVLVNNYEGSSRPIYRELDAFMVALCR